MRGPCFTLVGGAEAMIAALARADQDLARGRVREAVVVGCDLAGAIQAAVLVLDNPRARSQTKSTATTASGALASHGGRSIATLKEA